MANARNNRKAERSLGTLDAARLKNIPPDLRERHEFCFFIHDSMLSIFRELSDAKFPTYKVKLEDEEEAERLSMASDPISYFIENGHADIAQKLSVGQAIMALTGDFLHFIYETLTALEKRKFAVAFSLLRKPFKENLLFLSMILADEDRFFADLGDSPADKFDFPEMSEKRRREIFDAAIAKVPLASFASSRNLISYVFDRNEPNGFAPMFDKALHLVTRNKAIKTEEFNLNFIFKNPMDNDIYEHVYQGMAYVMMYALLLVIELFKRAGGDSDRLANWFSMVNLSTYHALFEKGRSPLVGVMNRTFKSFLKCPHCTAPVKVTKGNSARFFVAQKLSCKSCGLDHDFPLFWLMSQANWSIHAEKTE